MPNYCDNALNVRGPVDDVNKFHHDLVTASEAKDGGELKQLKLSSLYPCPEELEILSGSMPEGPAKVQWEKQKAANLEKYGFQDWYDWCVDKWGTKWGDCDTEQSHMFPGETHYYYQTAWSPCLGLIQKLSEMYPTLIFTTTFEELGMGFLGVAVYQAGNEIFAEDGEIGDGVVELSAFDKKFEFTPYDDDNEDEYYETLSDATTQAKDYLVEMSGTTRM
jgi:hypothetical protein